MLCFKLPVLEFVKSSLKRKSHTSVWVIIFCWHLVYSLLEKQGFDKENGGNSGEKWNPRPS